MGKKKTEARKRMPFVAVLAALLAVILLFAAFAASYIRKFDSTIKEENRAHLAETAGTHCLPYRRKNGSPICRILPGDISLPMWATRRQTVC